MMSLSSWVAKKTSRSVLQSWALLALLMLRTASRIRLLARTASWMLLTSKDDGLRVDERMRSVLRIMTCVLTLRMSGEEDVESWNVVLILLVDGDNDVNSWHMCLSYRRTE